MNEHLKVPVCSVSAALVFVFWITLSPKIVIIVIASSEKKSPLMVILEKLSLDMYAFGSTKGTGCQVFKETLKA